MPHILSGAADAVGSTTAGRVRGFLADGVYTFLGIPYGGPTGGPNRFRAPRAVEPWDGVRNCLVFGAISPQQVRAGAAEMSHAYREEGFIFQWREGIQSEDCLNLNVWTPAMGRDARLPVMVWLHGGHFAFGASSELPATHGDNLSRRGDVVVVSVNHRLNIFGFLDASRLGPDYEASANSGMLDIVLALQWVRDNIAAFGGDPDCVTVFGQSGGGAKVTTLMAMPAARGLFHRAIVQSNCALRQTETALSQRVFDEVLAVADTRDPRSLLSLPARALVEIEAEVMRRLALPDNPARRNSRIRWEPIVDGRTLPRHAFDPDAPAISADIPLLVGTNLNEFNHGIGRDDIGEMTDAQVVTELVQFFGDEGQAIHALLRRKYPGISAFELRSRAYGATIRESAVIQARRKAAQGAAPAWLYWFRWQTPALDGRPGAFHSAELPFVFWNADRSPEWTGGDQRAMRLADRVAGAWVAFARYGSPGHADLPDWPPVSARGCETMIFDDECRLDSGSDSDERTLTGAA